MTPSRTGPAIIIFADSSFGPSTFWPPGIYARALRFPYYNSYWDANTANPTVLTTNLGQVFAQNKNGIQDVVLAYHCTGDPNHLSNTLFKLASTVNPSFPSTISTWLANKWIIPGNSFYWPQIIAVDYIDINTNANLAQVVALNVA